MKSKHGTLTGSVVSTETITLANADEVVVQIRAGTGPIYYTIDGSTPTVAGDDTYAVTAGFVPGRSHRLQTVGSVTVKLISASADAYSVEVGD